MVRYLPVLAWAWIIIIGVLMITLGGVVCIACGFVLTKILGIASLLLGVVGFLFNRGVLNNSNPMPGR